MHTTPDTQAEASINTRTAHRTFKRDYGTHSARAEERLIPSGAQLASAPARASFHYHQRTFFDQNFVKVESWKGSYFEKNRQKMRQCRGQRPTPKETGRAPASARGRCGPAPPGTRNLVPRAGARRPGGSRPGEARNPPPVSLSNTGQCSKFSRRTNILWGVLSGFASYTCYKRVVV